MSDLSLSITRIFDAPVERVFDTWLDGSWGEWAGPPGATARIVLLEPHVGGRYQLAMQRPDGGEMLVGGTYRIIERPSKLAMTWKWATEEEETLITLNFRSVANGTEIHLTHEGFGADAGRDNHQAGWAGTLDKLAARLAGGRA